MDAQRDGSKTALLADVEARLPPEAAAFARLLFERAPHEDLVVLEADQIARFTADTLKRYQTRKPGRHRVEILDSPVPDQTIIEIVNDDMPFLVDSVLGELTETGCEIHLLIHPTLTVARAADGTLETIGAASGRNKESLIQVHVGRIASPSWRTALASRLDQVLSDVRVAVVDWHSMLDRLDGVIAQYRRSPPPLPPGEIAEAMAFLDWLRDDNFIFLGTRDYRQDTDGSAERVEGSSLGVLREQARSILKRGEQSLNSSPQMKAFLASPRPLIVTKSSLRSNVHRRVVMDYVGVKLYAADGSLAGEVRFLGLFTSAAYNRTTRSIPYVRQKVDALIAHSGFDPRGHSGKVLINVLETLPRDELFQMDDATLTDFALQIMALDERPRIRVLVHNDPFDRYTTVLVHVPRERYTTEVRGRVGAYLEEAFAGRITFVQPTFLESGLARIQYTLSCPDGDTPRVPQAKLEKRVAKLTRTWPDRLSEAFRGITAFDGDLMADRYLRAFPATYQAAYGASEAVADSRIIEGLSQARDLFADYVVGEEGLRLKLYHRGGPIPLSDRVPVLENMGLRVIDEQTFEIQPQSRSLVHLHDMTLELGADVAGAAPLSEAAIARLEACLMAVWTRSAEDDGFNRLVLAAGLGWREIALLRALTRYLRQIGLTYTLDYAASALVRNPGLAGRLVELFHTRNDPDKADTSRADTEAALLPQVEAELDGVASLDDDTILRRLLNLVRAVLRTNLYTLDAAGKPLDTFAFKLDSRAITDMPSPRPLREIWVYSPRVEGVHLRFSKVARGGLRWSDRPQDFRTEVLGLVKAQQVKNAVIVPAGAKGGFVPRWLKPGLARDAFMAEGTEAYRIFVRTLLSLTDNLDANGVVPPPRVVRHDGDDPYLVVAADKGTATFSDTANALSLEQGFWLGDAFASGGSVGYDHKKMAITARGAFEAVRRHFREIDIDIATTPFTVAGVGDMSGDVFGNGMLLAPTIRLVAAFDHRDIFLDPDPDIAASLAERHRLFDLPRSSWADYDKGLISQGGGVFSRSLKHIELSPEIRAALGTDATRLTPAELIRTILKAPVDLLWFGGIGTYIRSPEETDLEAGDRANDAVRITSADVRARIIGEGANLGVTQRARIAYGLAGGRCNSDAIDNSAGVNCSDVEVNIKIALGSAILSGDLSEAERPDFLAAMTDEVAALVLANNRSQTLAIGVESSAGLADLSRQGALMRQLSASGLLDRVVEFLPDDAALARRRATGHALTRSEIGVLLAYAKMSLKEALLASEVPDDPFLADELRHYFPTRLAKAYPEAISGHRLRREILSTRLANAMIDRGGTTFVSRLIEDTGATPARIASAFITARAVFGFDALSGDIEAATGPSGAARLALHLGLRERLVEATVHFLRSETFSDGLGPVIARYGTTITALRARIPDLIGATATADIAAEATATAATGIDPALSARLAALGQEIALVEAVIVAGEHVAPESAARAIFAVADGFGLDAVTAASRRIEPQDRFDAMVMERARAGLTTAQRSIAGKALAEGGFEQWLAARSNIAAPLVAQLREIAAAAHPSVSALSVASGLLQDIANQ